MTDIHQLAEHKIQRYESQLKYVDNLIKRAFTEDDFEQADIKQELEELVTHRAELANYIEELKDKTPFEWAEDGGPMILGDYIAQRIEELVERIEH